MNKDKINIYRNKIDEIDEKLVSVLLERYKIVKLISKEKNNDPEIIVSKNRVEEVINKVINIAIKNDGNSNFIENVYRHMIDQLTELQFKERVYTDDKYKL